MGDASIGASLLLSSSCMLFHIILVNDMDLKVKPQADLAQRGGPVAQLNTWGCPKISQILIILGMSVGQRISVMERSHMAARAALMCVECARASTAHG